MLNFTVGPVMSSPNVIEVANHSTPYFRTPEFSEVMLENEYLMLKFLNAPEGSHCVFLTTSGTGAMESCVMNILNEQDKVIVIDGGGFGHRFVEMVELHQIVHTVVKCEFGHQVREDQLKPLVGQGYTALLVNMDETSSGVLYDMELIALFCKKNHILLIIDAISAFITDEIDMSHLEAAAIVTGSQKALAVQPGISVVALAPYALKRIGANPEKCMYLSLKLALKNMERGQTPFTPAVTTLLQINRRLKDIEAIGGIEAERENIVKITNAFRKKIKELPFDFVVEHEKDRSKAVTAIRPLTCGAKKIVQVLKDEYGIWVCPNGGELSDSIFRIGHIGHITLEDIDTFINALHDMQARGII